MKTIRLFLLIMMIAAASSVYSQAPQRFNYQAVARDASGNAVSEKPLGVRITIHDNSEAGTELYQETFSPTTTKQGLFSIQVGGGNVSAGSFSSIVWGSAPKFLKVEIDPAGGSSYQLLGITQLLSVPYALAAEQLASPLPISELSDVSDVVPMVDQVLKWDGTNWTPGTGSGLVTTEEFLGDGSSAQPLRLAPQGATNGQVLQFNGTTWLPATVSGGVGDNWGTQSVVSSAALSGAGTAALPLTIAQQGASNGQVLKWNGTAWAPATDAGVGDNWGTAKVNTSVQFSGDGTPGNPLKLAQNTAEVGEVMMWDGTGWTPGSGGGSLTLPFAGNIADAGSAIQIQNNTGSGIVGINASASGTNVYGVHGRVLTSTGTGAAGVYGQHGSTGANGVGVLGFHAGGGAGVSGESAGAGVGVNGKAGTNGIGMFGSATGATSYGVVGLGNTGVSGTSNTVTGNGIYGNATAGGYAGWFDARTMIRSNSTASQPNLSIWEDDINDKTRIRFNNGVTNEFWDLGARTTTSAGNDLDKFTVTHFANGDILTVSGDKRIGVNLTNPAVELDVNGSIKLNGGLIANSSVGTNGQVLTSNGSIAQWGSSTNALFNNTYLYDQTSAVNGINTAANSLTGLNNMTFTITQPAKVILTFSHGQLVSNGSGDVDLQVEVGFMNATATVVINKAVSNDVIHNNKKKSVSYTHHCFFVTPGQYLPYVYVGSTNGAGFNASNANGAGQVTVQVIPQ